MRAKLAAEFRAANEPARRLILAELLSDSVKSVNHDLVALAMRLRDDGEMDWSETIFGLAAMLPHERRVARIQRCMLWTLQNRLALAVETYEQLRQEADFPPQEKVYIARQYARHGDLSTARGMVEQYLRADPSLYQQAIAELQFFDYHDSFPLAFAQAAYERLLDEFDVLDDDVLMARIHDALRDRKPFSLIRLGDGEGIHLQVSAADEGRFCALYERGRTELHQIWYGGTELVRSEVFLREAARVPPAYMNADCLSVLNPAGIGHEYSIGSPRGIPALNNMARFLLGLQEKRPPALCLANVHYRMLISGNLGKLLQGRKYIGLICCYDNLPNMLRSKFQIGEIDLILTYGEVFVRQTTAAASKGTSADQWMENHFDICRRLSSAVRPGELYILAAGMLGKLYCDLIKQQGAVAIDIGSAADALMNVGSRRFPALAKDLTLTE